MPSEAGGAEDDKAKGEQDADQDSAGHWTELEARLEALASHNRKIRAFVEVEEKKATEQLADDKDVDSDSNTSGSRHGDSQEEPPCESERQSGDWPLKSRRKTGDSASSGSPANREAQVEDDNKRSDEEDGDEANDQVVKELQSPVTSDNEEEESSQDRQQSPRGRSNSPSHTSPRHVPMEQGARSDKSPDPPMSRDVDRAEVEENGFERDARKSGGSRDQQRRDRSKSRGSSYRSRYAFMTCQAKSS